MYNKYHINLDDIMDFNESVHDHSGLTARDYTHVPDPKQGTIHTLKFGTSSLLLTSSELRATHIQGF